MSSKHTAHTHFLQRGLFDNLAVFAELEARISALDTNKERGDAFEIFAEAYFATQKIALAREVWPFEAIPLEQRRRLSLDTGRDMGVDGIYETTDGELRAYQVKFRSRRPALTWEELSTFMGLTDQVVQRVLFTNSETLPSLMQDRSGFVAIRGSDLDRLTADDFTAMREWLASGKVELRRKQPLSHQEEALEKVASGLVEHDRATVVMACGTGKSLVSLWAAERFEGKTLLVLVPSLALVRQLLHEWLRETSWQQFSFMCVCSDPTVAKGADDLVVHQADLDFPVTTDSAVVRQFLGRHFTGIRIVFSTYQSAQVVAAGMPADENGKVLPFDMAIFDEAHKTASRDGTRFSFALEDRNLPIRKRLFFTATPRHYDVRKKDKEGDNTLVYSMDKPEIYGPVVHTLSFAEAARRNIICDYKVVISVVTSAMVDDHALRHGETIVAGDAVKTRQVALQIALQKAVEKYGVSRIFTFHGSVKAARSFTADDGEGIVQHLPDFTTLHVSGEMPTARREDQMKAFRQAQKAVMSNARCLTEGVDVPAVDMVAFISPRKSKVDIVQATGRAMRRSPGKEFGYVMVPLFVEQAANESIEDALKRTGFDDVWDLLGAMREQDDVLVDIIRQMQEDKGRTGGYNDSRFSERVEVLGPSVSLDTIRESITAECLESLGVSWEEKYGELLAFAESEGHALVPNNYCSTRGVFLGQWVGKQRAARYLLTQDRKVRLESVIGWVWDVLEMQWEDGFSHLVEFADQEGHCLVPAEYKTSKGFRLGTWVTNQRAGKDELSQSRKEQLESVKGWTWDVRADQWEQSFLQLVEFVACEGHCQVPRDYQSANGIKLGQWIGVQRNKEHTLSEERKTKLESVPSWSWDIHSDRWESAFKHLVEYSNREGHCMVPGGYKTPDGFTLGKWVVRQRSLKNELSVERKRCLESLSGWIWDVLAEQWEIGFQYLADFVSKEGHCRVPQRYKTPDGFALGSWVTNQKTAKDCLLPGRKMRLESIAGWAWNSLDEKWEIGFEQLKIFLEHDGHCKVPQNFQSKDGYRLGSWVTTQRTNKEEMSSDRKARLEALTGWLWDAKRKNQVS
jgi:superfamily II DNA or RNA helicase